MKTNGSLTQWLLTVGLIAGSFAASYAVGPPAPAAGLAATLKAQQWHRRIVLIYAPSATDAALVRQRRLLAQQPEAVQQRDVLVLEALPARLSAPDQQFLLDKLGVPVGRFSVLLIGKDGGVKRRQSTPFGSARPLFDHRCHVHGPAGSRPARPVTPFRSS